MSEITDVDINRGTYKAPYTQEFLQNNAKLKIDDKNKIYFLGKDAVKKFYELYPNYKETLNDEDKTLLEQKLINEGLVLGYYYDREFEKKDKKITFGVGHNAEVSNKKTLIEKNIPTLFVSDLETAKKDARNLLNEKDINNKTYDDVFFNTIVDIVFNMGKQNFSEKFPNFWKAAKNQKWGIARDELLKIDPYGKEVNEAPTKYVEDVGQRAIDNAEKIALTGERMGNTSNNIAEIPQDTLTSIDIPPVVNPEEDNLIEEKPVTLAQQDTVEQAQQDTVEQAQQDTVEQGIDVGINDLIDSPVINTIAQPEVIKEVIENTQDTLTSLDFASDNYQIPQAPVELANVDLGQSQDTEVSDTLSNYALGTPTPEETLTNNLATTEVKSVEELQPSHVKSVQRRNNTIQEQIAYVTGEYGAYLGGVS